MSSLLAALGGAAPFASNTGAAAGCGRRDSIGNSSDRPRQRPADDAATTEAHTRGQPKGKRCHAD
jgi:hypothetical protein